MKRRHLYKVAGVCGRRLVAGPGRDTVFPIFEIQLDELRKDARFEGLAGKIVSAKEFRARQK